MIGYTIKAKPTMYNGRLYRSRLEARFAVFFDLKGVDVEYEPFDLYGWSPDFVINNHALVEIKPKKEMFDIRKYLNVDFEKHAVMLLYPGAGLYLSDDGISTFNFTSSPIWIESANKVMFLKPAIQ